MHVYFNVFSTLSLKRRANTLTFFHCYINASAFCFSQLYRTEQSFSKENVSVCSTSTCSYLGFEENAEHLTLVHCYIKSYSAQFSQLYKMTIAAFLKLLSSKFILFFYSRCFKFAFPKWKDCCNYFKMKVLACIASLFWYIK